MTKMKMMYCCNEMVSFLEESKVSIGYSPRFRSYYINLKGSEGAQRINFCPWCGSSLPKALDEEYDEELSKVLNINKEDITLDTYHRNDIPPEFKSDEWWKIRGL